MAKKAPDAFRTISEVSDALDTPAHVLRFWESKFNQIKPVKRAGGRRYYRPDDINLLSGIKTLLHDQGMTIKGAQKLLREQGVKQIAGLAPIAVADASSKPKPAAKRRKAAKVIDPEPAEVIEEQQPVAKPAAAEPSKTDVTDLPSLDLVAPTPDVGLLSVLSGADRAALRAKADRLSPIVARLEDLHARMSAA